MYQSTNNASNFNYYQVIFIFSNVFYYDNYIKNDKNKNKLWVTDLDIVFI